MSVYSSLHASESHRQGNQFDLGNTSLRQLGQGLGIAFHLTKEVLRLRGVFRKGAHVPHPAAPPDELAFQEIARLVEALELEPVAV